MCNVHFLSCYRKEYCCMTIIICCKLKNGQWNLTVQGPNPCPCRVCCLQITGPGILIGYLPLRVFKGTGRPLLHCSRSKWLQLEAVFKVVNTGPQPTTCDMVPSLVIRGSDKNMFFLAGNLGAHDTGRWAHFNIKLHLKKKRVLLICQNNLNKVILNFVGIFHV